MAFCFNFPLCLPSLTHDTVLTEVAIGASSSSSWLECAGPPVLPWLSLTHPNSKKITYQPSLKPNNNIDHKSLSLSLSLSPSIFCETRIYKRIGVITWKLTLKGENLLFLKLMKLKVEEFKKLEKGVEPNLLIFCIFGFIDKMGKVKG